MLHEIVAVTTDDGDNLIIVDSLQPVHTFEQLPVIAVPRKLIERPSATRVDQLAQEVFVLLPLDEVFLLG